MYNGSEMIWLREQSRKGLLGKWIIADWNSEAHETTRQCATICNTKSQHASWSPCYCITLLILLCWDSLIGVQTFGKTLVTIITALLRFLSSPNWGASWLPWTLLLRCLHPWSSLSPSSPYWNNWYGQGNSQLGLPSPKLPPRPHFSNSLLPGHPNPFQSPPSKSLHHQIWIPSQTTPRLKPYDQLTILPTFIPIKLITPRGPSGVPISSTVDPKCIASGIKYHAEFRPLFSRTVRAL